MKRIATALVAILATLSTYAQKVEVYLNGKHIETYYNTPENQYRFVFKQVDDWQNINGYDYVEIGGRKWAKMNVGATSIADSPETSYGNYYAWGELDTYYKSFNSEDKVNSKNSEITHIRGNKFSYNWINYCTDDTKDNTFKEWNPTPFGSGTVLQQEYDVANWEWKGTWRIPMWEDFQKLYEACGGASAPITDVPETITKGGIYWIVAPKTIDGTTYNVNGVLCVATADRTKRVFFPAAGNVQNIQRGSKNTLCTYWSSSLYTQTKQHAYCLYVNTKEVKTKYSGLNRAYGLVIRPVSD